MIYLLVLGTQSFVSMDPIPLNLKTCDSTSRDLGIYLVVLGIKGQSSWLLKMAPQDECYALILDTKAFRAHGST